MALIKMNDRKLLYLISRRSYIDQILICRPPTRMETQSTYVNDYLYFRLDTFVLHFCRDKDIPKDPNGIHTQTREATVHIVRLVRFYIH
jgi:hypothetical protein